MIKQEDLIMKTRCEWADKNEIMSKYHDEEWGKPLHDDQKLFEFLILEGMQAGLSCLTILKKSQNYLQKQNFRIALVLI